MKPAAITYADYPTNMSLGMPINSYPKSLLFCDKNTYKLCLPLLLKSNPLLSKSKIFCVAPGEKSKTLATCQSLWEAMLAHEMGRDSLLIHLGGGVITDLGGFAAATYKRGIDFINIPTTLLAMSDAAIGGKTGINFKSFKNSIGTFAQAQHTFIFTEFLKTLPQQEILSGFAEIIKHALLSPDTSFWNRLKKMDTLLPAQILDCIQISNNFKSQIIQEDFYDKHQRKILNFGHTIGHAIESASLLKKKPLPHGIAVAAGIIAEIKLSTEYAGLPENEAEDVIQFILKFYKNQVSAKNWDEDLIISYMQQDKKNINAATQFVLLKNLGFPQINCHCSHRSVKNAMQFLKKIL